MSYMTDKVDDVVRLLSPEVPYRAREKSAFRGVPRAR